MTSTAYCVYITNSYYKVYLQLVIKSCLGIGCIALKTVKYSSKTIFFLKKILFIFYCKPFINILFGTQE